jgi:hypothetical protein
VLAGLIGGVMEKFPEGLISEITSILAAGTTPAMDTNAGAIVKCILWRAKVKADLDDAYSSVLNRDAEFFDWLVSQPGVRGVLNQIPRLHSTTVRSTRALITGT